MRCDRHWPSERSFLGHDDSDDDKNVIASVEDEVRLGESEELRSVQSRDSGAAGGQCAAVSPARAGRSAQSQPSQLLQQAQPHLTRLRCY